MCFCYWRICTGIDLASLGLPHLSADATIVSADIRRHSKCEEDSPTSVSADIRRHSKCEEDSPTSVSAASRYKGQLRISEPEILINCTLIRIIVRNNTYRRPADTTEDEVELRRNRVHLLVGAYWRPADTKEGVTCILTLEPWTRQPTHLEWTLRQLKHSQGMGPPGDGRSLVEEL